MLKRQVKILSLLMLFVLVMSGCGGKSSDSIDYSTNYDKPEGGFKQLNPPEKGEEIAVITTNFGVIKVRFFPEYAPMAVENFVTHAKEGYYDGLIFHRVIDTFMIQGGDPEGTGMGGESIWGEPFAVESTPQLHHIRGALAMAKSSQPVSIGSQFYIVQNKGLAEALADELNYMLQNLSEPFTDESGNPVKDNAGNVITMEMRYQKEFIEHYLQNGGTPMLDYGYTVFGQTFEGFDVIDRIAATETNADDKPLEDVIIESIVIEKY